MGKGYEKELISDVKIEVLFKRPPLGMSQLEDSEVLEYYKREIKECIERNTILEVYGINASLEREEE
jgi:hypothetical protein